MEEIRLTSPVFGFPLWCVCVAMVASGMSACSSGSLRTNRDGGVDAAAVKSDSALGGIGGVSTATGGAGGSTVKTGGAGGTRASGAAGTTTTAGGTGGTTTAAGGAVVVDAASDAPADASANPDTPSDTGSGDAPAADTAGVPEVQPAICGGPGQPCCAGSVCENAGCCGIVNGESNRCIAFGSYCFPDTGGAICTGGTCPSNPGPCGASGQPCCVSGGRPVCTAPDTACVTYSKICMMLPSSSADAAPADRPLVADGAQGEGRRVPDAGSATGCSLPTTLTFGYDGGDVLYQDVNKLDLSGTVTATRTPVRASWDGGPPSCSRALPACGTPGAITAVTIAADLADAGVQAAFAASSTPLYGFDWRPADGPIYSIAQADGHTILVGAPCSSSSGSSCLAIPAGVQHLTDDLRILATATLADPACQGL